jgi:hypothetical protein
MIWGESIPVTITNGEKPCWLDDDDICAILQGSGWLGIYVKVSAQHWTWRSCTTAIKLPADHPYYAKDRQMTDAPVTLEALEAAAKYAGWYTKGDAEGWFRDNRNDAALGYALAKMIMKHEPELITESFDARTEREFGDLLFHNNLDPAYDTDPALREYRRLIQQHIEDAKP